MEIQTLNVYRGNLSTNLRLKRSLLIHLPSCCSKSVWLSCVLWNTHTLKIYFFFWSHTRLYREYITSSEMYSLHLTHPKWTHARSSGQPCYSARGALGSSVPCTRTPQSWYWRRRERWLFTPPPTIPAGPEIRTHNLWITSPTL